MVTKRFPGPGGKFQYRIKHPTEPHERIAWESPRRGLLVFRDILLSCDISPEGRGQVCTVKDAVSWQANRARHSIRNRF